MSTPNPKSTSHTMLHSTDVQKDSDKEDLSPNLRRFIERMPKIELHAHLNGCIREKTLSELAAERNVRLSSHHFDLSSLTVKNGGYMYNRKPRSLLDCFDMFAEIPSCVNDLVALARITQEALEDFCSHHVLYLELRSTPKRLLWNHKNNNGTTNDQNSKELHATKRDYVETILSVMESFEKKQQHQGTEKEHATNKLPLVPRFIMSIDRAGTIEDAMEHAQLAIDLHREGNPYLVGVDLGGNPTKNDFSDFEPVFQMVRDAGLKVTIHCGEDSCGTETATQHKAYKEVEAVLQFCPDRIGHALLLPPSLRQKLEESSIPVECCPTSNVMTLELATHFDGNLVQGLRLHPQLEQWLKTDHPLSVSTDDSGVFNTDPTQELLLLALAWNLDQPRVQRIVLESIEHAFCGASCKVRLKQHFMNFLQHSDH